MSHLCKTGSTAEPEHLISWHISPTSKECKEEAQDTLTSVGYQGWPHFPVKTASSISSRQEQLRNRIQQRIRQRMEDTDSQDTRKLAKRRPTPVKSGKSSKDASNRKVLSTTTKATTNAECGCVHKSILNCLLPGVFHDTLNDLESIRVQLKATQLRHRKLQQHKRINKLDIVY